MKKTNPFENLWAPASDWIDEAGQYWIDAGQRAVLFMDILRRRGNTFLEHQEKGQPPVLTFDYKIILDGRKLDRPVNYDLVRIVPEKGITIDQDRRPIVIIDPRAGHGPGIGGSKKDSEVGVAMREGHPVYFVTFYPMPCPGQTLADVTAAEIAFIEEVARRHPEAEQPAVIGNCQAGWAVALLSAERPDVTGPLVLNGSPLSYWAGVVGESPMRYRGGIFGGIWLTSLLSDLGNGKFDGANLVANFETLNPANTYWTKQYNLWKKVDTEADRYLNFERWWNGYFCMTADEIRFILKNLFIGNKLEKGLLELYEGKKVDLRNLDDPLIVFASAGDNITSPQQALSWIPKLYPSVADIRRHNQVIVYILHEKVGHLGIFVSGAVARKEHKEIIGCIDLFEYLPPGLYEMVIDEGEFLGTGDRLVRCEERNIQDILALDDGFEDEEPFRPAQAVSELNDWMYQIFVSPWIRMWATETGANVMRQLHPLRMSKYAFSDRKNPFLLPIKDWAERVRQNRQPVSKENTFLKLERSFSDAVTAMLNLYQDNRDTSYEFLFNAMYGNPWVNAFFPNPPAQEDEMERGEEQDHEERWLGEMEKGGFAEGVVRMMVAMAGADHIFDKTELVTIGKIVKANTRLKKMKPFEFKRMIKVQSHILEADQERALHTLPKLLPTPEDREAALAFAREIARADMTWADEERTLMERFENLTLDT